MFSKLKFNNLVISNKKQIRKGRIQTANKLIQKIRKLKTLTEKQPNDEKNKERLRKVIETMEELKKLKCVEIIKRVLLLNKNPNAIITNGRSTPDEIAIALLSLNKLILDLKNQFQKELNLSSEDPKWKNEIMKASKRENKRSRTEDKREKRKKQKEQKVLERKRIEWLRGNNIEGNSEETQNNGNENLTTNNNAKVKTSSGIWQTESINDSKKPENKSKKLKTNKKERITNDLKKNSKLPELVKVEKTNLSSEDHIEIPLKHVEESEVDNPDANLEDLRISTPSPINVITNDDNEVEEKEEVTHVEDPFFFTENGENYLSTAVIKYDQQNSDNPFKSESENTDYVKKNHKRNFTNALKHKNFTNEPEPKHKKFVKKEIVKNLPKQQVERIAPLSKKITVAQNGEQLHPSWIAKQKLKPVIAPFQGKKITFNLGDNDT